MYLVFQLFKIEENQEKERIKKMRKKRGRWIVWLGMLLFWCVASYVLEAHPFFIPKPHQVAIAFFRLTIPGEESIWIDLLVTVRRILTVLVISIGIGVPIGIAIGSFQVVDETFTPLISFLRAIPVTAYTSLFLFMFGLNGIKAALATFGCTLLISIGSTEGVRNTPQELIDAADLDGANKWQLIRYVTFWTALPHIYTNLRTAVLLAAVIVIVLEQFIGGSSVGLGGQLRDYQRVYERGFEYAVLMYLGFLGLGLNLGLKRLRKFLITW